MAAPFDTPVVMSTSSLTTMTDEESGRKTEKERQWNPKSIYVYLRRARSGDEFNRKIGTVLGDCLSYMWLTCLFVLLSAMPLGLLILGSINWKNCQAQPNIPFYMVVVGSLSMVKLALCLLYRYMRAKSAHPYPSYEYAKPSTFDGLLSLFLAGWTIMGSIWVFGADVQFEGPDIKYTYCDWATYWSAYIYLIICLVFVCLVLIVFAVYVTLACILCNRAIAQAAQMKTENVVIAQKRNRKKDLPPPVPAPPARLQSQPLPDEAV